MAATQHQFGTSVGLWLRKIQFSADDVCACPPSDTGAGRGRKQKTNWSCSAARLLLLLAYKVKATLLSQDRHYSTPPHFSKDRQLHVVTSTAAVATAAAGMAIKGPEVDMVRTLPQPTTSRHDWDILALFPW
ncbi:hypothetical protein ElyMa_000248800 [Elysia marginata]|uniref:Uncharacterized protein n=1 Tax=Elysia marginata TaxID=1093978 RepID=A0AAV4F2P8_9GAST|nr:hypothetical protein ElyMa_000248800 [Elysia marginata]